MSQKFHSTKSLKPLVEDDRPKPQTPKLHKPQKPPITTAKPIDEVHWITKPNSAMHRVELPASREVREVTIDTSDASGKLPDPGVPASTPDAPTEVEPESKIEQDSHWMPETTEQGTDGQDSKAPDTPDSPPQAAVPM